jgi:hypothetical protein
MSKVSRRDPARKHRKDNNYDLMSVASAGLRVMKNWLAILSFVWLMSAAGALLIERQQVLFDAETNSAFPNPAPVRISPDILIAVAPDKW